MATTSTRELVEVTLRVGGLASVLFALPVVASGLGELVIPALASEWFSPSRLAIASASALVGAAVAATSGGLSRHLVRGERAALSVPRSVISLFGTCCLAAVCLMSAAIPAAQVVHAVRAKPPWDEVPFTEFLWVSNFGSMVRVCCWSTAATILVAFALAEVPAVRASIIRFYHVVRPVTPDQVRPPN